MDDGLSTTEVSLDRLIEREWLATNRLGGYASSTVAGLNSRKYHGLLVAAMLPPVRRLVILSRVEESVVWEDGHADLACNEYPGAVYPHGHELLRAFNADPHPRWAYQSGRWTLEKHVRVLHGSNTVVLTYTLVGTDAPIKLELRPLFALRAMHDLGFQWNGRLAAQRLGEGQYHIPATNRSPEVFFASTGHFRDGGCWYLNTIYRREQERGYAALEDLWCPGVVEIELRPGQPRHFVCSTDQIDYEQVVASVREQTFSATASCSLNAVWPGLSSDADFDALRRAADVFPLSIGKAGQHQAMASMAGYPWFAPSLRASLIGFSGLFLVTGKHAEARSLLQRTVSLLRNGLLPSEFSEATGEPIYRGADVSLWFIHAVDQYLRYTADLELVRLLLDALLQIVELYQQGTDLGIVCDSEGLLSSQHTGIPTSWMDGKTGDIVITPRAGRPVELNALWYNAIAVVVGLAERFGRLDRVVSLKALMQSVQQSFNRRFWNEMAGCCFDVVSDHAPDPAIRPNQLLAMSLPHPVLNRQLHQNALDVIRRDLLTPRGLRTLSPRDPGYAGRYVGTAGARDRAYHNGSVFPWLLGPFVTATLRLSGRAAAARQEARKLLEACINYLQGDGLGNVRELFDGDSPHTPRGAIASAVSIGELLRCYAEDILDLSPTPKVSTDFSLIGSQSSIDAATV